MRLFAPGALLCALGAGLWHAEVRTPLPLVAPAYHDPADPEATVVPLAPSWAFLSPDGRTAAATLDDYPPVHRLADVRRDEAPFCTVGLWNTEHGRILASAVRRGWVVDAAFCGSAFVVATTNTQERYFVPLDAACVVEWWDARRGAVTRRMAFHASKCALRSSRDGRYLACALRVPGGWEMRVLDGRSGRSVSLLTAFEQVGALFSPDGRLLLVHSTAAGSDPSVARLYETATWRPAGRLQELPAGSGFEDAVFSADGRYLAALVKRPPPNATAPSLFLWDLASLRPRSTTSTLAGCCLSAGGLFLTTDGRLLDPRHPTRAAKGVPALAGRVPLAPWDRGDERWLFTDEGMGEIIEEWHVPTGRRERTWRVPGATASVAYAGGLLLYEGDHGYLRWRRLR